MLLLNAELAEELGGTYADTCVGECEDHVHVPAEFAQFRLQTVGVAVTAHMGRGERGEEARFGLRRRDTPAPMFDPLFGDVQRRAQAREAVARCGDVLAHAVEVLRAMAGELERAGDMRARRDPCQAHRRALGPPSSDGVAQQTVGRVEEIPP